MWPALAALDARSSPSGKLHRSSMAAPGAINPDRLLLRQRRWLAEAAALLAWARSVEINHPSAIDLAHLKVRCQLALALPAAAPSATGAVCAPLVAALAHCAARSPPSVWRCNRRTAAKVCEKSATRCSSCSGANRTRRAQSVGATLFAPTASLVSVSVIVVSLSVAPSVHHVKLRRGLLLFDRGGIDGATAKAQREPLRVERTAQRLLHPK
jgi:hypothetical protein